MYVHIRTGIHECIVSLVCVVVDLWYSNACLERGHAVFTGRTQLPFPPLWDGVVGYSRYTALALFVFCLWDGTCMAASVTFVYLHMADLENDTAKHLDRHSFNAVTSDQDLMEVRLFESVRS